MDPPTLDTHLADLTTTIDTLTSTLTPLLRVPLHQTTSTLPLLDKAKLYILLSYTIESLLYQSLLTAGTNAKEHPIFAELARLKTYFKKLQDAENPSSAEEEKKRLGLDKAAAGRFIKAGLSGNDKYDRERAEKIAKEKARAALKARELHNRKFDDGEESAKLSALRKAEKSATASDETSDSDSEDEEEEAEAEEGETAGTNTPSIDVDAENEQIYGEEVEDAAMNDAYDQEAVSTSTATSSKKQQQRQRKKPGRKDEATGKPKSKEEINAERREKKQRHRNKGKAAGTDKSEETILPARGKAPKTPGETFKQLLEGPVKKNGGGKKGKGKGKK